VCGGTEYILYKMTIKRIRNQAPDETRARLQNAITQYHNEETTCVILLSSLCGLYLQLIAVFSLKFESNIKL